MGGGECDVTWESPWPGAAVAAAAIATPGRKLPCWPLGRISIYGNDQRLLQ